MSALRTFEEYQKEGRIRKDTIDKNRARSLIEVSDKKMKSTEEKLEKIGINENNANDYAESCYDIILLLTRAKMYSEGYTTTGQGAHEAEVSYLRKIGFSEKEVQFIDQLRYLRNGILYYGKTIDEEYAKKTIDFTKTIQPKIKKLIKF